MAHWQLLESKKQAGRLFGGITITPQSWRQAIITLQKRKEINPNLDSTLIYVMLSSLINGANWLPYFLHVDKNQTRDLDTLKNEYITMIIDSLYKTLAVTDM